MACRRESAAIDVAKEFKNFKGSYEVIKCDLSNLESVKEFANTFKSKHKSLHGLVCNAGMVNMKINQHIQKMDSKLPWLLVTLVILH